MSVPDSVSVEPLPASYRYDGASPSAELRHISRLKFWPLRNVLTEKYLIPGDEADALVGFLQPMLLLDPSKRTTARESLSDSWIDGIVVQGEEELEEARRRGTVGLDADDKDALKPVPPVVEGSK